MAVAGDEQRGDPGLDDARGKGRLRELDRVGLEGDGDAVPHGALDPRRERGVDRGLAVGEGDRADPDDGTSSILRS